VSPVDKKKPPEARAHLRVTCQKKGNGTYYYVQMRWGSSGKHSKLLGVFSPTSPTPLMDSALYAAHAPGRLELEELYKLLQADKSFQIV